MCAFLDIRTKESDDVEDYISVPEMQVVCIKSPLEGLGGDLKNPHMHS
jgi:hypothetical protein